jgi:hypothetical protein
MTSDLMMKPYQALLNKKAPTQKKQRRPKRKGKKQQEERTKRQHPKRQHPKLQMHNPGPQKRERERESNGMSCFGGSSFIHSFHF